MGSRIERGSGLKSVVLDTSFLITLSNPARANHATAKRYYQEFIERSVTMYLSTIVISEFEIKQQIIDLGVHNFLILPFNVDDAKVAAQIHVKIMGLRSADQSRDAVKDDVILYAQAIVAGISHFATDDQKGVAQLNRVTSLARIVNLPTPLDISQHYTDSFFNNGQNGLFVADQEID